MTRSSLGALLARVQARLARTVDSADADRNGDAWLTYRQAAVHLNVPVSWIADRARAGVLRSHKLGHYVRLCRRELDEDATGLAARGERD